MLYKQLLSLLLILPPLLFNSCDKNTIQPRDNISRLPPITMEGKNTFGCLLNGEVWVYTPRAFNANLSGSYSENFKHLHISARRTNLNDQGDLESYIKLETSFEETGIYDFSELFFYNKENHDIIHPLTTEFIIEEEPHFIKITHFDLDNFIVSALFQFSLLDTLTGDTLRFTEGRFDYKWAN